MGLASAKRVDVDGLIGAQTRIRALRKATKKGAQATPLARRRELGQGSVRGPAALPTSSSSAWRRLGGRWRFSRSSLAWWRLYTVVRPVSTLMLARMIEGKSYQRVYAPLRTIAPPALAAVIASEDASFCDNGGVDWGALREVLSGAGEHGPSRGASTITMQTAKNLFLWPGRSTIRKGVEIGMALVLGEAWSKARTLEIYLNIAEWGDGIYGIEAAAAALFPQERKSTQSA